MSRDVDEYLADSRRYVAVQQVAQLLYARFLIDPDDARKCADMVYDLITKDRGRGNRG